jgi:hypothetical protein
MSANHIYTHNSTNTLYKVREGCDEKKSYLEVTIECFHSDNSNNNGGGPNGSGNNNNNNNNMSSIDGS